MHALLITFESTGALDAPAELIAIHAAALRDVDGLVEQTWLRDGITLGGFHLFVDRASAEAFLEGDPFAAIAANLTFRDFRVRHFGVLDTPRTGGETPLHPPAPP
jgi:hypothetical protein